MEFFALQDGWIKIPAEDFPLGLKAGKEKRLMIGVNQLLVRISGKTLLVDAGLGDKFSDDELGLLGSERPRTMLEKMSKAGISPSDIDFVILTHLHYDHVGGCTRWDENNLPVPVFPNAIHVVQKTELDYALNPSVDDAEDYRFQDFEPLIISGQLIPLDGAQRLLEGVLLITTPGHSVGHQVALFQEEGENLLFAGDLFSTNEHAVSPDVITSYDKYPSKLVEQRRIWLRRIEIGGWTTFFCHNIRKPLGRLFQGKYIPLNREDF